MSRPLYETPENLKREQEVANAIKEKWKCDIRKLPIAYRLDYMILKNNKPVAVLEIKCRNAMYEEMYLSLHKWMAGKELSRNVGVPFILAYEFKDKGIYWHTVNEEKPELAVGGRTDRGDWQDIEPMVVFRLSKFTVLK
jgi:hypothetical protein